jgi:hypothetical protein
VTVPPPLSWTDHVHAVSLEPVMAHANVWEAPAAMVAVLGDTVTATTGGAAKTVTVAVSVLVGSAWLFAMTW